jgi:hypothetical protein
MPAKPVMRKRAEFISAYASLAYAGNRRLIRRTGADMVNRLVRFKAIALRLDPRVETSERSRSTKILREGSQIFRFNDNY